MATGRAQFLASRIFAGIGLALDWKDYRSCADDRAIRIALQDVTPAAELPGALAYSMPEQGRSIVVFYDRVQKAIDPPDVPSLLTHVLVHEIAHILQGFKYHSQSGMMKAYWSGADFRQMARRPLPFTDADIWLIRGGLERTSTQNRFIRREAPSPESAQAAH